MSTFLSGTVPIRLRSHKPNHHGPHPALILFHGSGGNVDPWLQHIASAVSSMGVAIFAVHYFDRTQTTQADPILIQDGIHFPLWLATAKDALSQIAEMPDIDARRIALFGISLGAFLSLALATEAKPIRVVIEVSDGLVEPWSTRATSAFPPTLIFHGEVDTTVPVSFARGLDDLLSRLDIRHQTVLLANETHRFSSPAIMQILSTTLTFLKANL
jgi:carboxymethylenebutenolidase